MPKRPRIGSVIEIQTARGLAYAQVTHFHREPPRWGWLIRAFSGFHKTRPEHFDHVALGKVQFSTFYPVGMAVNDGLIEIVGHAPITPEHARFPIFKNGIENRTTGKIEVWWLWDGKREWRVNALSEIEQGYPRLELITGDLLRKRLESVA